MSLSGSFCDLVVLRLTDSPFLPINFWTQALLAIKDGESCAALHFYSCIARALCEIIFLETRRPLDLRSCTHSKSSSSRPTSNGFLPPPSRRFLLLLAARSLALALCHSRILLRPTLNFFVALEILLLSSANSFFTRIKYLICQFTSHECMKVVDPTSLQ